MSIAAGSVSADVTVNPFDGTGAEGSETVMLTILIAPVSGHLEYHDITPLPGQAFYRAVQP